MLFEKMVPDVLEMRESMIYPECWDVFNQMDVVVKADFTTVLNTRLRVFRELGENLFVTNRYGFCVAHGVEVENYAVEHMQVLKLMLVNRTGLDILMPFGAIVAQIVLMPNELVGR
jgi:hypothetical protein